MEQKDVIIIGGGPAGYAAAIRVAQLGGKATLIEKDTPGGTCVTRGCIPVRALVRAAELMELGKSARDYGISYGEPTVDFTKMMARKDTVIRTVVSGVKLLLEGNGVEVIVGSASLTSPNALEVRLPDGSSRSLAARRVIVSTGSRCHRPDGFDDTAVTTDDALGLKEVPGSVVVIGGGFVGLAFASIFSRLGSRTTVVEESERLLPEIDAEIVSVLEKELKRSKVQIHTAARAVGTQHAAPPSRVTHGVTVTAGGKQTDVQADLVLIAESRRPNTEDAGLASAGVTLNSKGGIAVTRRMETNVPGVFAAGDVTMEHTWTHVAYAEGIAAAENAMGMNATVDYSVTPFCANTLPEMAGVGMTEEAAVAEGHKIRVGRFPFAANATATIMGQRTGAMKIIAEEKYGQILGAHCIGPQAANLISEIALAMKLEATPRDIGSLMHGHPTLSEVCWEAARDVNGETIHFMRG